MGNDIKDLVKVVFEYKDGTKKYLDGSNLKKWVAANASTAMMSFIHGGRSGFEGIVYKTLRKKK